MKRISLRSTAFAVFIAAMALSTHPVFAAATGVAAVDTAKNSTVTFITGIAGIAALALLGLTIWDYVQHRNVVRGIFELVGVILCGVIAVNAQQVATFFGVSGAVI